MNKISKFFEKNKITTNNPKYALNIEKIDEDIANFNFYAKQICDYCDIFIEELKNENYFKNCDEVFKELTNDIDSIMNIDAIVCSILPECDKIAIVEELKEGLMSNLSKFSKDNAFLCEEIMKMVVKANEIISELNNDNRFCFYINNARNYKEKYVDIDKETYFKICGLLNDFDKSYTNLSCKFAKLNLATQKIEKEKICDSLKFLNSKINLAVKYQDNLNYKWDNQFVLQFNGNDSLENICEKYNRILNSLSKMTVGNLTKFECQKDYNNIDLDKKSKRVLLDLRDN